MKRIPEPEELMDGAEQALAYAEADFSEPNALFVDLFSNYLPAVDGIRVLDLGCGPADIPLAMARRWPNMTIDAVDGAQAMLDLAHKTMQREDALIGRLNLICETLPSARLPGGRYDALVSNSLLHHLADPRDLWLTMEHCAKPDALILVMDLARPASGIAVDALVETHALDAPDVLREDFRNSLYAAYTPAEVEAQLRELGWKRMSVGMVSDRHWAACGRPR